jgi:hypothetical protein
MIYFIGIPAGLIGRMTLDTIIRKTQFGMTRRGCCLKIRLMARRTIVPYPIESQLVIWLMTFHTIGRKVRARKWKSILKMDFGDAFYEPILGGMTTYTIIAHRFLVHISMAGNTRGLGFLKFQTPVTISTIRLHVLARERKGRWVMVKPMLFDGEFLSCGARNLHFHVFFPKLGGYFPACRQMAGLAVDGQIGAVRTLC